MNLSPWANGGNATKTRITSDFLFGAACMEVVCAGTGNRFVSCDFTRGSGQSVILRYWLKTVSGTPAFRISIWKSDFSSQLKASGAMAPVQTNGAWSLYVMTALDAELFGYTSLKAILDDVNTSAATWRVDNAQAEAFLGAIPGTTLLVPAPVAMPYDLLLPGADSYPGSDVYPAAIPTLVLSNAATRPLTLMEP